MQPSPTEDPSTLFSPCPACGKPRPIDADTHIRCVACGQEHPVEPELVRAAKVYREARANVPLQIQQTSHIDELISQANAHVHRFRIAAGLMAAPLFGLFVFGVIESTFGAKDFTRHRIYYVPAYMLPLLVLIGSGLFTWIRLSRSSAAVQSLLWARPMSDVPGELACRMCGASLGESAMQRGTVKCRYCHTENMVGPDISRRAAKLALVDYTTHARAVQDRLNAEVGSRWWAAALVIAAPLLVLALGFGITRNIVSKLASKRLPLNESVAYVKVQCPSDDVGTIWKASSPGETQLCSDDWEKPVLVPFQPSELRGREILSCDVRWDREVTLATSSPELKGMDLFSDGFGRNHIAVDAGFKLFGECFVESVVLRVPPITPKKP